jgi:protein involved in polysaccharide export with SLBB domain
VGNKKEGGIYVLGIGDLVRIKVFVVETSTQLGDKYRFMRRI